MKIKVAAVTLLLIAALTPLAARRPKATLAKTPLTDEQVAVYQAFLAQYDNGAGGPVNLGNRTVPFELSDGDRKGCGSGLDLQDLDTLSSTTHHLSAELAREGRFTLVDPEQQTEIVKKNDPGNTIHAGKSVEDAVKAAFAAGLLGLSEIAFDREHRFAVLHFSFFCGGLCGQGGTVVFEKVAGRWSRGKRSCGSWIS